MRLPSCCRQLGMPFYRAAHAGQGEAARRRRVARGFHRRTGCALCSGRCCLRRRKPGAARRAQYYRARAARRRHRHREPHGKFSRHRERCFKAGDAVRIVGLAELPLTLMQLLATMPSGGLWAGARKRPSNRRWVRHREHWKRSQSLIGGRAILCRFRPRLRTPIESPFGHLRRCGRGRAMRSMTAELLRSRRLRAPVVSVGNLSAGGSGKTPFVLLARRVAQSAGNQVRRAVARLRPQVQGVRLVDPAGLPQEFGDEPLLHRTETAGAGNRRRRSVRSRTALPKRNSDRNFICWTTVFSTARWLAISILFW